MQRVLVVGITGAGKTTVARRLANLIGAPFHELDGLAFGPGWSQPADFAANVERLVAEPAWVVDSYGYPEVRDALWAAADTVVWLDYPRRTVLPRVVRRSVRRSVRREVIFGGNRESWRGWLSADHPVWWAMSKFQDRRSVLTTLTHSHQDIVVHRFHRPAETARWLTDLTN